MEITRDAPQDIAPATNAAPPSGGLQLLAPQPARYKGIAEQRAARALERKDWDKVVETCRPFASKSRVCAKSMAIALEGRGDLQEACAWYAYLRTEAPHGCEKMSAIDGGFLPAR